MIIFTHNDGIVKAVPLLLSEGDRVKKNAKKPGTSAIPRDLQ